MRAIYSIGKQNEKITHKEKIPGGGRNQRWGRVVRQQGNGSGSCGWKGVWVRERERRVNVDFEN